MGLHRMTAGQFWTTWDKTGRVFLERKQWLKAAPELYQSCLPEGREAREEALTWMHAHSDQPEPDWMVLSTSPGHEPRLIAGEVVFPSSWSLPDKLGQPISRIHHPVPGLQEALGTPITAFLQKLVPGDGWARENWGLASDGNLNHHPSLKPHHLDETATLDDTWVRVEHQFLTRLSGTNTLLFGIRVSTHLMKDVAKDQSIRLGMSEALKTMPEAIATYKGLDLARRHLINELERWSS